MATANVDRIRRSALESADRSARDLRRFLWLFAFLELGTTATYVVLAVLGFSEAVLIGVAGACVYTLIASGLFGLKFHIDATTQRLMSAMQLLAEDEDERRGT